MKKKLFGAVVLAAALCMAAGCAPQEQQGGSLSEGKQPGGDSFEYEGNYTAPELTIDGLDTDAQWQSAPVLATFGRNNAATVKVYRGAEALFFYFTVSDTVLLTEGEANDDTVTRSDSVELYLDTLADGGSRPQSDDYQINLGIHGKTRIMQGAGSQWGNWNGLIDYEVSLDGTLNDGTAASDTGYSVEVMVPYSQIGIERTDTIGVSFAQVDKWGAGASSGTDWDWFGWTFEGTLREPQTPDNYVLLDAENNLTDRDAQEMPPADMAGYVRDNATGDPIVGATASVVIDGETRTACTDSQGYFVFADVDSDATYTVIITMDGYLEGSATYSRSELRAAEGGAVTKNIALRDAASVVRTDIKGTVENIVNGTVAGAIVTVEGVTENGQPLSATTDENGAFTIERVPADVDVTLLVSKAGYGDSRTYLAQEDLTGDGTTEAGDVNLNLPYGETGPFGLTTQLHAENTMQVSRTLTGVEMLFSGKRAFTGNIELFIDTKASTGNRDEEETAWRLDLHADGTIGGTHFAGGALTVSGLDWQIFENGENGYEARLFLPYTWLDIEPLEVFGISLGQLPDGASWDGWGFEGVFIDPASTVNYVRVSALNRLYRAESNEAMVTLSGNAGAGVTVTVGEQSTTTAADGSWSLSIPQTAEAVQIVYSRTGYVTQTYNVEEGSLLVDSYSVPSVTLKEHLVTFTGTITAAGSSSLPVEGAVVTVVGTQLTDTTDSSGEYTIEGVPTTAQISITFTADGYVLQTKTYTVAELAELNEICTLDVALESEENIRYLTVSGTVENVNGPVSGAKIMLNGLQAATTNAKGEFTIENFVEAACELVIEADGYLTVNVPFDPSETSGSEELTYSFGSVDMPLTWQKMNGLIADKSDDFASFTGYVTRSAVGFEFRFTGAKAFTGRLELFVDTGTSAGDGARDNSDYLFNLNADGTVTIVNWGDGEKNETVPSDMKLTVENADTAPVVTFTLPYTFLGVEKTDVIGISAGQFSATANSGAGDWDGWDNFALPGANGEAYVKPEMPQDYVRIGARNELYAKADNAAVDFSGYEIRFATGENTDTAAGSRPVDEADDFRGKVASRDASGVTFEFLTTGDFSKEGEQNEFVLIYFDTGDTVDGWNNVDYLIKIASDGTVYGSDGTDNDGNINNPDNEANKGSASWWSAGDNFKLDIAVEITRENGVTHFTVTVPYTLLGIGADDVFGIAMREASHNAGDHHLYDPWYDCYYNGTAIDAANSSQYVRVAADGTLYSAANNNTATAE